MQPIWTLTFCIELTKIRNGNSAEGKAFGLRIEKAPWLYSRISLYNVSADFISSEACNRAFKPSKVKVRVKE